MKSNSKFQIPDIRKQLCPTEADLGRARGQGHAQATLLLPSALRFPPSDFSNSGQPRRFGRSTRLLPGQLREAQVFAEPELGEIDDLAGVISEMLDDVGNCMKPCDAKLLDGIDFQQIRWRQLIENAASHPHLSSQQRQKNPARNGPLLLKLPVAVPNVRLSTQPCDNPLAHVAGKMQHQIPSAVRSRIRPPPDVFFGQPSETFGNAWQVVPGKRMFRIQQKQEWDVALP